MTRPFNQKHVLLETCLINSYLVETDVDTCRYCEGILLMVLRVALYLRVLISAIRKKEFPTPLAKIILLPLFI